MATETVNIPFIEQAKIQAQVLVPLIKALQAELGEERANALVRKALGDSMRKVAEEMNRQAPGTSIDKVAAMLPYFSAGDALDAQLVAREADKLDFNVTGCRYAQFYKELGAPELGFLLLCSLDYPMAEGVGADLELQRTQTIMQGASHCDFRWRLKKEASKAGG
jgi:predicted ArsR family transcriptional regulator